MLSPTRGTRQSVTAWLQTHLATFLDQVGTLEQLPLAPVRSWLRVGDFQAVPEEQTPACYLTAGSATLGLVDAGGLNMWADVTGRIVFVVAGRDRPESEDRAALYCDAARYCLQSDVTLAGTVRALQVTGWGPAGTSQDHVGVYRAVHDLAYTCSAPTSRNLPTTAPAVNAPIHLQLDRLEP